VQTGGIQQAPNGGARGRPPESGAGVPTRHDRRPPKLRGKRGKSADGTSGAGRGMDAAQQFDVIVVGGGHAGT
jgi:hypothetical protein